MSSEIADEVFAIRQKRMMPHSSSKNNHCYRAMRTWRGPRKKSVAYILMSVEFGRGSELMIPPWSDSRWRGWWKLRFCSNALMLSVHMSDMRWIRQRRLAHPALDILWRSVDLQIPKNIHPESFFVLHHYWHDRKHPWLFDSCWTMSLYISSIGQIFSCSGSLPWQKSLHIHGFQV